jgi:Na+-driven multidrug efflux pump
MLWELWPPVQAYGAESFDKLGTIFQRTCAFLSAHAMPITALVLSTPTLYLWMGQDAAVCRLMSPYVLVSLPGLWLDVVDRPMNRMLTAQGISLPQMFISGIGATFAPVISCPFIFAIVLEVRYVALCTGTPTFPLSGRCIQR